MDNKIVNFFFAGNAVSSELDYGLAETFVRSFLDNPLGQINAKYGASGSERRHQICRCFST